jgi:hypothetical protein
MDRHVLFGDGPGAERRALDLPAIVRRFLEILEHDDRAA